MVSRVNGYGLATLHQAPVLVLQRVHVAADAPHGGDRPLERLVRPASGPRLCVQLHRFGEHQQAHVEAELPEQFGIVARIDATRDVAQLIAELVAIDRFADLDAQPVGELPDGGV